MEKVAILGASRGLGAAIAHKLVETQDPGALLLVSRKSGLLSKVCDTLGRGGWNLTFRSHDLSCRDSWLDLLEFLKEFEPTRIVYTAGGGPFGSYFDKKWLAHEWTYRVNFLTPSFLMHNWITFLNLKQMVFVGSDIAESQPDPYSASYSASKHALLGLISSIRAGEDEKRDIRLFSPTYLDTDLLPESSWPREKGLVQDLDVAVQDFVPWMMQETDQWHRVFRPQSDLV